MLASSSTIRTVVMAGCRLQVAGGMSCKWQVPSFLPPATCNLQLFSLARFGHQDDGEKCLGKGNGAAGAAAVKDDAVQRHSGQLFEELWAG